MPIKKLLLNFRESNKPRLRDRDSKMKNLLKRKQSRKLPPQLLLLKLKPTSPKTKKLKLRLKLPK